MADFYLFPSPKGRDNGGSPGNTGNGNPPGGDGLEARIAKLEIHAEYVRRDLDDLKSEVSEHRKETRSDFRILFGALITASLGLAALMAHGFKWI